MKLFGKIILARRLSFINNNSVNLMDPIIELSVPFLPTTMSFSLYGNIISNNPKQKYKISIKLVDEKSNEIVSLEGDLDNNSPASGRTILPIDLNFDNIIFREEGKHNCVLTVDGEQIAEYEFIVYNQKID